MTIDHRNRDQYKKITNILKSSLWRSGKMTITFRNEKNNFPKRKVNVILVSETETKGS